MYVCLCNAVTDKEIHAVVRLGARTFDDVRATLGVATCCGRCTDSAKTTIANALNAPCAAAHGGD